MPIRSICPKCGKMGTQYTSYYPNKANPRFNYLQIVHSQEKRCHIGRIRTEEEAMSEFNTPQTTEEYEKMLSNLASELRGLTDQYSPNTAISVKRISNKLNMILKKYGL